MAEQWEIEVRNSLKTLTTQVGQMQKGLSDSGDKAKRLKDELRAAAEQAKYAAAATKDAQRAIADGEARTRRNSIVGQDQIQRAAFAAQQGRGYQGGNGAPSGAQGFRAQHAGNFISAAGASIPGVGGALSLAALGPAGAIAGGVGLAIAAVVNEIKQAAELAGMRERQRQERSDAIDAGRDQGNRNIIKAAGGTVSSVQQDLQYLAGKKQTGNLLAQSQQSSTTVEDVAQAKAAALRAGYSDEDITAAFDAAGTLRNTGRAASITAGMQAIINRVPRPSRQHPMTTAVQAARERGLTTEQLTAEERATLSDPFATTVAAQNDNAGITSRAPFVNRTALQQVRGQAEDDRKKAVQDTSPEYLATVAERDQLLKQFEEGQKLGAGAKEQLQVIDSLNRVNETLDALNRHLQRQATAPIGIR